MIFLCSWNDPNFALKRIFYIEVILSNELIRVLLYLNLSTIEKLIHVVKDNIIKSLYFKEVILY